MTDGFDPDAALASMGEFLAGHRTLEGYARFADTVRGLHNHISGGGALPSRWAGAQYVTVRLFSTEGPTSEHQVGVGQKYTSALDARAHPNWLVVMPGLDVDGDDDPEGSATGVAAGWLEPHDHAVDGPAGCRRCQMLRDNKHWMEPPLEARRQAREDGHDG